MKPLLNPRLVWLGIFILFSTWACKESPISESTHLGYPSDFPPITYDHTQNQPNQAVIHLGRKLFYDVNLSLNRTVSCGSCHAQVHGFADHNTPISFGIFGRKGMRNSPAIVNVAWMPNFMWDAGIRHLDVMPIAPFTDTNEMGMTLPLVLDRVRENPNYKIYLKNAFGSEDVDERRVLLSLSQFMLRLISDQSKYDRVRRNQERFNELEAQGYQLFKSNCSRCHQEPLLTNNRVHKNGITKSGLDLGRFRISQNPTDSFAFKVPTLRNVTLTYPYMHNGSLRTLDDVLEAYNKADRTVATELPNFYLDAQQKQALIAFLESLTDYSFISNLDLSEPR